MGSTAVKSNREERVIKSGKSHVFIERVASSLDLHRSGVGVLRDWQIHAEFSAPAYQRHNVARLQHLDSLGLNLTRKKILELGAGIGDHTLFYLYRNCTVLAVEGRAKLAKKLSERLGVETKVIDFDREPQKLEQLGRFDFAHCYGLLYHLSDPGRFLCSVARAADCLLLETCVSFGDTVQLGGCAENSKVPSQALHGSGCRPTRTWVFEALKLHFKHVYATKTQPRHPEFPLNWNLSGSGDERLARCVFVASHHPIDNPSFVTELPSEQIPW
jgi:hypothetical protein